MKTIKFPRNFYFTIVKNPKNPIFACHNKVTKEEIGCFIIIKLF